MVSVTTLTLPEDTMRLMRRSMVFRSGPCAASSWRGDKFGFRRHSEEWG